MPPEEVAAAAPGTHNVCTKYDFDERPEIPGGTMERLTKSFSVFDCDAHINDPMGIWDYVPESQKELVRNTYWRGDAEAWLNGDHTGDGRRQRGTSPATTPSASRARR